MRFIVHFFNELYMKSILIKYKSLRMKADKVNFIVETAGWIGIIGDNANDT